jgi:type IV pilus assembly protein PilA
MLHTRKGGFTLIELMIVVAIIGILAAIAIPNFLRFQAKSKQSEAKTNLGGVFTAQTAYLGEKDVYGTFTAIAWSPIGTNQRYTYYSGLVADGSASGLTDFKDAPAPVGHTAWAGPVTPGVTQPGGGVAGVFTAGAIGNVDTDAAVDIWTMTQNRALNIVSDDVAID